MGFTERFWEHDIIYQNTVSFHLHPPWTGKYTPADLINVLKLSAIQTAFWEGFELNWEQ